MRKRILSFITFTEPEQCEEWQLNNDVEIAESFPTSIDEEGEGLFITFWKYVDVLPYSDTAKGQYPGS